MRKDEARTSQKDLSYIPNIFRNSRTLIFLPYQARN